MIFELLGYDYNDVILLIVGVGVGVSVVRGLVSLLKLVLKNRHELRLAKIYIRDPKNMKKAFKSLGKYHSKKNQK